MFDRAIGAHRAEKKQFGGVERDAIDVVSALMDETPDKYRKEREFIPRLRAIFGADDNIHKKLPRTKKGKQDVNLSPGQQGGVMFMLDKDKSIGGSILADEPGIGKTAEIQAHILLHRRLQNELPIGHRFEDRPILLLTTNKEDLYLRMHDEMGDTSKVYCYRNRIQKCLGNTRAARVEFKRTNVAFKSIKGEALRTHIVVASYTDLIQANRENSTTKNDHRGMFETVYCDIRFCEITKRGQLLLRFQAPYRWIITGTPIVDTLWDARGYVAFLERPEFSAGGDRNADETLNPDGTAKYLKVRGYYRQFWDDSADSLLPSGPSETGDVDINRNTADWKPQPDLQADATEKQKRALLGKGKDWPIMLLTNTLHRREIISQEKRFVETRLPKSLRTDDSAPAATPDDDGPVSDVSSEDSSDEEAPPKRARQRQFATE
ncbi:hypothetical protein PRZ48_000004 [Zasmidium cellare]|uniref:SNF2 N-terminal domain-containing protein n=1 Tax=Zasmidium cellare TaxID=395010 RepID=A0ABR0EX98_ZASCE|nr:hypothetical protein PRZ48_000004 [Zasmidium cellare]